MANITNKNGFANGSIISIKLENFMTYANLEFKPGPNMNIIIGPNGTGKSTIMCAICLGLGGKPGLIGRAGNIGAYVKIGKQRAKIEIKLCQAKSNGSCVIGREITKTGSSSFTVDGRTATANEVELKVSKFNIQMSNLCQFLPQDRVAEFVKMSQQDLLENTEKAAGHKGMYEDHCKLKEWHVKAKDLEVTFERLKEDYDKEVQQLSRLEEKVKTFQERELFQGKIKLLEKKKYWMQFSEVQQEYIQLKEEKKNKEKEVQDLKNKMKPMLEKSQLLTAKANEAETKTKEAYKVSRDKSMAASAKIKQIEKEEEKVSEIVEKYNNAVKMEEQRNQSLAELKQQLEMLEKSVPSESDNEADIATELVNVNREMQQVNRDTSKLQEEIHSTGREKQMLDHELQGVKTELNRLQDVRRQKLDMLRRVDRDAYEAVQWLRSNKDKLKKTIHEPLLCVINVKNSSWAKYVEAQIPFKDMIAFVCEDDSDLELFVSTLRDKQKLKINVVSAPKKQSSEYISNIDIESLRHYGFYNYLKDMFEAPDAVVAYMCQQYNVHNIPVGNEHTRRNVDEVLKRAGLKKFFTENHSYVSTVSLYGNRELSTRSSELKRASLLVANVDMETVGNLQHEVQQLNDKLNVISNEQHRRQEMGRELSATLEQLRNKKKDLVNKRDMKNNLVRKIEQKKESIRHCEEDKIDLDAEKEQGNNELRKLSDRKIEILRAHQEVVKKWVKAEHERMYHNITHWTYLCYSSKHEKDCSESQQDIRNLENELNILRIKTSDAQHRGRSSLEKAKRKTGIQSMPELEKLLEKDFPDLPNTLEAVENELASLKAQADCLQEADESIIEVYRKCEAKVKKLSEAIEEKNVDLVEYRDGLEGIHGRWFPPLQQLISQININFSHYFASLKCAGEVGLNMGENDKDYSRYGISIKVKYRDNEQLRELTSHYQSGGERSVATILYLLAIQEFIKLPFCCVDEINQGMDSTNERRVFNMMTQTICQENRCQYFLVTPKLLPDLQFGKNVVIHTINNGTISIPQQRWQISKFLQTRANLL